MSRNTPTCPLCHDPLKDESVCAACLKKVALKRRRIAELKFIEKTLRAMTEDFNNQLSIDGLKK